MADPLSVSASIAGLVTLADVLFRRTYKYVKAVKKASKEISALSTEIGALYGILSNLSLVSRQLEDQTFESTTRIHHIYSCYQTLEHVKSILDRDDTSSLSDQPLESLRRKLRWPFTSSEAKDLTTELERHKTTLGLALNVDCLSGLLQALSRQDQFHTSVEGIRTELKERHEAETRIAVNKERQEIMNSFAKADPRSNHDINRKLRSPGTGLWLTEGQELRQWLETDNARLWLFGIPGAGKTVLASSIIEEALRMSSRSSAVAFFYCDFKNPATHDLSNILGSLAQQFAKQDEESFAQLRTFYETHNPEHRPDFKYDAESLSTLVRAMTLVFDCAMIIIDGLDECGTNVSLVVDSLTALNRDEETTVKTIFLSRDEIEIRERLENYTKVSIAARSSDLRLYVGAEIDLRTRQKRLRIKDESLKEYVLERLVEGAEGMFRWVTCQMDYLCELPNDAARRKALGSLPPDLNSTYERILSRVNHSNPETQKLVRRALRWITCGQGYGCTVEGLCEAVSIDFGDTRRNCQAIPDEFDILKWCSSLVRKSADGLRLELAHFTVQEFLEQIDPKRDISIGAYRIEPARDRVILAKICFTYLNFEDFDQGGPFSKPVVKHRFHEYPFRPYALLCWADVIRGHSDDAELLTLVQKLFCPSKPNTLISWMHDFCFHVMAYRYENKEFLDFINLGFAEATALHFAAMFDLAKVCSWLIESGCDVNRNTNFGTPLHCAILGWQVIDVNLKYRFDFWKGKREIHPEDFHLDTARLLLESGADPNCYLVAQSSKLSPLFMALSEGHDDLAAQILDRGGILDSPCLERLEDYYQIEDIYDILDHTSNHNVSQENHGRLLQLALRAGTTNPSRLVQKDGDLQCRNTQYEHILRFSAESGQVKVVLGLLENQKLDIDAADEGSGLSALHNAVRTNQLEIAQILIDGGADLNKSDSLGWTAIHHSVQARELRCLRLLLQRHADTSLPDLEGMTVLHRAAQEGNVHALTILLSRPLDLAFSIGLKASDGRTPLLCASANGSEEAMRLLLSAGSNLAERASDGCSPLHYAVSSGSLEGVKLLISEGVDSCAVTHDGSHAIHCAVRADGEKLAEIMHILLENGVDPCKARNNGCTPLHDLVRIIKENSSSPDRLESLFRVSLVLLKFLQEKSRLVSEARLGSELVYLACSHSFPSAHATISALLELPLDPNILFADGRTALMAAAKRGNVAILNTLLLHGADPCINSLGSNVLHCACFNDHRDILVRLRETSVDWNSKISTTMGNRRCSDVTALHIAAQIEDSSVLRYFLNENLMTNIDARIQDGRTPLMQAVFARAPRNVFLLLSNGAVATVVDIRGKSAIHWAAQFGNEQVISEFIRYGSDLGLPDSHGLDPELTARKFGYEALANRIMDYVNEQGESRNRPNGLVRIIEFHVSADHTSNGPQNSQRSGKTHGTLEALKIAIDIGDFKLCTRLVENGMDLGSGFESCMGCTPLLYSLARGNHAISEYLVSQGASTAGSTCELWKSRGFTVFHHAVSSGSVKLVQSLLDKAPSEIYAKRAPIHPMHLAVYKDKFECVKIMLDHVSQGKNAFSQYFRLYNDGSTNIGKGRTISDGLGTFQEALGRMVNMHVGDMLHWSWYAGPGKRFGNGFKTARPSHIAASQGHSRIVKILLEHGAHIDGEDSNFRTPLHYAASNGQTSIVKLLLDSGVNPNAVDSCLESPCMVAAKTNRLIPLQVLMRAGGDVRLRNEYGQTALHLAAISGAMDIFLYLVSITDVHDLGEEDVLGRSIFYEAIRSGIDIPMTYLLNLAPPAGVYESSRVNILNAAVESCSTTQVKMLIRRLPNDLLPRLLDHRGLEGNTPLCHAAVLLRVDTLKLLLDTGAQLELEGSEHGTALMAACATGRLAAVKVLIPRGARTSYVKDGQWHSALLAAKHHSKIRRWLLVGRFLEGPRLLTY